MKTSEISNEENTSRVCLRYGMFSSHLKDISGKFSNKDYEFEDNMGGV